LNHRVFEHGDAGLGARATFDGQLSLLAISYLSFSVSRFSVFLLARASLYHSFLLVLLCSRSSSLMIEHGLMGRRGFEAAVLKEDSSGCCGHGESTWLGTDSFLSLSPFLFFISVGLSSPSLIFWFQL
jgi:hypothetical protein